MTFDGINQSCLDSEQNTKLKLRMRKSSTFFDKLKYKINPSMTKITNEQNKNYKKKIRENKKQQTKELIKNWKNWVNNKRQIYC